MDNSLQGNRARIVKMHKAAMEIVETVGMKFLHPEAIKILKEHDIRVEGDVAYFTEEQLMYWVRKAPYSFTLYAQNPKYDCVIGGQEINPAPGYGCPSITEPDGSKRNANMDDYVNFIKLFHSNDDYKINGGPAVQPYDVEADSACLAMFWAALTHSDKALMVDAGKRQYMDAMIDAAAAMWGGKEALKAKPRMITLVNVNSPMCMGEMMTDTLLAFAEAGQPFAVADLAMAGSSAPMTLAGTVTMIIAEVLPIMALAEMVNPGTPVIFGSQSCTADMATGQIAAGSAEGALCYAYTAQLADFYGLPSRGGGALTDSKVVDAQSGYESMITLMANYQYHTNFIIHAAGILDGFASTSYEKVLQDFEVLHYIKRFFREFEINDETIPLDLIKEVDHDGEYLTADHTFDWCRVEPLIPSISSRGVVADPVNQLHTRMSAYYDQLIAAYSKPELDADTLAEVKKALVKGGLTQEWLDKVEAM